MIKKLKLKFILLSMSALFVLLAVIVTAMNVVNFSSVVKQSDEILSLLTKNKGAFPDDFGLRDKDRFPPDMSPELPYESRYFSVLLNDSGAVVHVDTRRIAAVDEVLATDYAMKAKYMYSSRGFVDNFRFAKFSEAGGIRITFLDCTRQLDYFYGFLYTSIIMALAGLVLVFFVIFFISGRIIRPIAESYEKQRRFITDAGHEIKTPLTIINANVDLLEMDIKDNECLQDVKLQTSRLARLTEDLTFLARMDEAGESLHFIDFPASEIVTDTVNSFRALALSKQIELKCSAPPVITVNGDSKMFERLLMILMDNALKYTNAGGRISVDLSKNMQGICINVFNTTAHEISRDKLRFIFDRFYRLDSSHNSETGGHGIGLSVAKAIVTAHGGKIEAFTKDGRSFVITALFPQ